jgi:nicotinamide-nucleotide amidase
MIDSDPYDLAQAIVKRLAKLNKTLAVAESITGGGLGFCITSVPGSSQVFNGGVIAYSDELKVQLLDVDKKSIKKFTPASAEVAIEMAVGCAKKCKSDFAISTTGVAGPGMSYGKKAGKVWIAIATPIKNGHLGHAIELDFSAATPGLKPVARRDFIRNEVIVSALASFERILTP